MLCLKYQDDNLAIENILALPNGQSLGNRIVKAAMTEGLADPAGRPSPELVTLYERWSRGGAGLLLTGNVLVDGRHLERPGNVVIDGPPDPMKTEQLARWAQAAKSGGASVWVQLSHAGRQTPITINPTPHAPSSVQIELGRSGLFGTPMAMTHAQIAEVRRHFFEAALVVKEAGFDGIQIHAAHGYLLSSFLSPLTNKRDDEWGGSLENRARLLLEIVHAIRVAVGPSFGVGVKLNSADFQRGGFDIDDSVKVAQWLDEAKIDILEISGGNYESPRMIDLALKGPAEDRRANVREAYFLEFAPRIKASLGRAKLMVTGGFRTRAAMDRALIDEGVDLIGIARPFCGWPDAPHKILSEVSKDLPAFEDRLRLGPGVLGPRSRFPLIRAINAAGAQAWYFEQIVRLGAGLDAEQRFSVYRALRMSKRRAKQALDRLQRSAE